jgi:hypothetical protein
VFATAAAAAAAAAAGALAIGAAAYKLTPGYGVSPAQIEPFSSSGQTPIMFTAAGQRLATPQLLQKPDVVGPDGTGALAHATKPWRALPHPTKPCPLIQHSLSCCGAALLTNTASFAISRNSAS